ncbi:bacterial extracellular solute-binding protein, family 7 [Halomonas elongata]|uniref:Bacterial extracellular solute-binding protein, family 7 n=1 Tax=Halomonas elongata TaxID=2746 RepID=A0A1B8NZV7_HALEL|nr:bacterial extracellular solute-binding protein, family 7 [Halomonas elongata]
MPTDMDTVLEFFDESKAINEMFPKLYAEHGLELLKMYPEGEMVVTADEPITSPEDFDNKKIRTMTNPLLAETYKAFGATRRRCPGVKSTAACRPVSSTVRKTRSSGSSPAASTKSRPT